MAFAAVGSTEPPGASRIAAPTLSFVIGKARRGRAACARRRVARRAREGHRAGAVGHACANEAPYSTYLVDP